MRRRSGDDNGKSGWRDSSGTELLEGKSVGEFGEFGVETFGFALH